MNFFCGFLFLSSIIQNIFPCVLDKNFFYHIKSLTLPVLRQVDPIIYIRVTTILSNGAFDALAPYVQTARGMYSNIEKRPENERTIRNKNIAIAYSSLRILNSMLPNYAILWSNAILNASLNPNDSSLDLTSPVGIGNYAAKNVLNFRLSDGMNQEGNFFGNKYNRRYYEDCIDYVPKNNPYLLISPNNWQPSIENFGNGIFRAQVHMSPQYGSIKSYSITNKSLYECPSPWKSKVENFEDYKNQADKILNASYNLNDTTKMLSEFFSDKILSLENTLEFLISKKNLDLDRYVYLQTAVKVALFDSSIIVFKEKIKHDSVRPISAIKYLYKTAQIKAWGGPGIGKVEDIRGNEWQSYINTPAHSEYPSATTCFCTTQAKILTNYFKNDDLNLIVYMKRGSSKIEPHITPSNNLILTFKTLEDFVQECGKSRLNAGVHFESAILESQKICKLVADKAFNFVQKQFYGF
jgi:hypothetical protein